MIPIASDSLFLGMSNALRLPKSSKWFIEYLTGLILLANTIG